MAKKLVSRKLRSIICANIVLEYGLFPEWEVFCLTHQKIKSRYRLTNLFLMKKKMLYKHVVNLDFTLNCDNLFDFYHYEACLPEPIYKLSELEKYELC